MTEPALLGLAVVAIIAAVRVLEAWMRHRERMLATVAAEGYTADEVALAIRAGVYRAAGADLGTELLERLVETVAEDLDAGVLTDPRRAAPPEA